VPPFDSLGALSPDGTQAAYVSGSSIHLYRFANAADWPLVAPEGLRPDPLLIHDLLWSPDGTQMAFLITDADGQISVGVVPSTSARPISLDGLGIPFKGFKATQVELAWSPDGSVLAALATAPSVSRTGPARVYLIGIDADGPTSSRWHEVAELTTETAREARIDWAPDGSRLAVGLGNRLWYVTPDGESTLRCQLVAPDVGWTVLAWAPDGSGLLAGVDYTYDTALYWFPDSQPEDIVTPTLLLASPFSAVAWAPEPFDTSTPITVQEPEPLQVTIEFDTEGSFLHFVASNGEIVDVPAERADHRSHFQVTSDGVYYDGYFANGESVSKLTPPREGCRGPLVSPQGDQITWLCDGEPQCLLCGDGERPPNHFRLIVTDHDGGNARLAWEHIELGPNYTVPTLVSWRSDGAVIYLAQPEYGAGSCCFNYRPGLLALDVQTGQTSLLGNRENIGDAAVSPSGAWLVQTSIAPPPDDTAALHIQSLETGTEYVIPCGEEVLTAGDFSFSPHERWLAWQEYLALPGVASYRVRAARLPDGEPVTLYEVEEAEMNSEPRIATWREPDEIVLWIDGTAQPGSYALDVTGEQPPEFLTPRRILGILQ